MTLPFQPFSPCCSAGAGQLGDANTQYPCGPGGDCPEYFLYDPRKLEETVCMFNDFNQGTKCQCVSAGALPGRISLGWKFKYVLARVDKPGRELAALVPRPIPYPATRAQQMELEVASGKYSKRHVSRRADPRPENPFCVFCLRTGGWVPDRFWGFPNEDCDGDIKRYCHELGDEILSGLPPCGGVSSCGDCSPPVWRCGPERTTEQIQSAVDSCGALIQPEERDRCFTELGNYLDCVNRYDAMAHAYQACLVQRIECLAKEEQDEKDCRSMRLTVWRTAIGLCMQKNGCAGWWGKFSGTDENGINQYEKLPQS